VLQSGYESSETYFAGRDEVASAIAVAEQEIASVLGYWPAPKYICDEVVNWPSPVRGVATALPFLRTRWGYIQSFGIEALSAVSLGAAVVYTDVDADGILDTATITVASLYTDLVEDVCEVVVVFAGKEADNGEWEIRPLKVTQSALGVLTITGPRWLFVDPARHLLPDEILLTDVTAFVATVDVYRRYTDVSNQGNVEWDVTPCAPGTLCASSSVAGCAQIHRSRVGLFTMRPATYADEVWTLGTWTYGYPPTRARVSYLAGYDDDACRGCSQMGMTMKEAIARLANVHLIEPPCECSVFKSKYARDTNVLEVTTRAVAKAQSLFGSATGGAVFALSTLDRLDSIGKGG
jgi:hypothetical protein